MNEKIVTAITDFMAVRGKRDFTKGSDDYEILKYGIALLYYETTKTILLIVISIILGVLPYTLAFMAIFGGLRVFARGIHFKSPTLCLMMGFLNYLVGIYLALNLKIGLFPTLLIYGICFWLNAMYAPSPTENVPIADKEIPRHKKILKILMTFLLVIMLVIGENAYSNIILLATLMETLYILPITYRIFKEKRG